MKRLFFTLGLLLLFAFKRTESKVHVFLIGDSTCANKNSYDFPETGWGQVFQNLFNDALEIENHAVNGRSTKSFRGLGHWKNVIEKVKIGDYVFIQFGHNDAKISDTVRYAAPQTDYRRNLIKYIEEIKAKGAIPVLLTPIMRRNFDENNNFLPSHGEYPLVVREVAAQLNVYLLDLSEASERVIKNIGQENSKKIFMHYSAGVFAKFPKGIDDDTHFSPYGAQLMANLVAEEIVKTGNPLKTFLKTTEFDSKYKFELPLICKPYFKKDTFNILKYGAFSDGKTLCTSAINKAIDICSTSGGGTVYIPNGLWITGPIVLKSNVNLFIAKGALLQFAKDYNQYPLVKTTWEGQNAYRCQAPISGNNLENIAISGNGIIDGGGDIWRAIKKEKLTENQWNDLPKSGVLNDQKTIWFPSQKALNGSLTPNAGIILVEKPTEDLKKLDAIKDFLRPNLLSLVNCKNIVLEGVTFQNSPAWTIHPLLCQHLTVENVKVKNLWYAQNSDAIDVESCKNVVLKDCEFSTGDDAITIKSGRDEQGRKRGVATENVRVENCVVYAAHGGFVIGSEMSGGVNNLFVSNCTFIGTDVGLRFKTKRGRGGIVENVFVNNIVMSEILGEAILFDMYYDAKDPVSMGNKTEEQPIIKEEKVNAGTPQFRNFSLDNIICTGAKTAILLRGLPEMNIENIKISNATIQSKTGLVCIEAKNIKLQNINLKVTDNKIGLIQNSKDISLENISFSNNIENLLHVEGDKSENIQVKMTDVSKLNKPVIISKNSQANAVKLN